MSRQSVADLVRNSGLSVFEVAQIFARPVEQIESWVAGEAISAGAYQWLSIVLRDAARAIEPA